MKNSLRLLLVLAVVLIGTHDGLGQCVITCPPGSVAEGEPCPVPINHFNGGCDAPAIPAYSPIEFDSSVCGRSRWIANFKDTDWYEFYLPFPGIVTWTVQAEFGFEARIVTHECPATLLVSGIAPPCSTLSIRSAFLPADTYAVVVSPIDSGFSVCRDYVGTLTRGWQPDNCGSIIVIPEVPFIDSASTVGATDDFHCGGNTSPDVIYSLVAPDSGWYLVSLCESMFDTRLEVRTGGSCPGDVQVACNDDGCRVGEDSADGFHPQSQLDLELIAGVEYFIIVDGSDSGDNGVYILEVDEPMRKKPAEVEILLACSYVGIAVDCKGTIYTTCSRNDTPMLVASDVQGNEQRAMPTRLPNGNEVPLLEISWDADNEVLWGADDDINSLTLIYQVDPYTGICTFMFYGQQHTAAKDGLTYDASDGTLWECEDSGGLFANGEAIHLDPTNSGAQIGAPLQPYRKIMGTKWRYNRISGICAVTNYEMYIALPERERIVLISSITGEKVSSFKSSGFPEGLECDAVNFAPDIVLWVQATGYNQKLSTAYKIPGGSFDCIAHGRCCYCENGVRNCDRLTEPECDALGGNWLYPATCDTPCTSYSPIHLDPFPTGIFTCDPCGVPQPSNFTFTLYIRNTSPWICNDLTIQVMQTGTGQGGTATITSPTTFNIGPLNGHGSWSEFVDVNLDMASLNPNGGCINFTAIINSSCCGPDTVDYCIEIPACPCPYDNYDCELPGFPPGNDECTTSCISVECPSTSCGSIYPETDEDWYAFFLPGPQYGGPRCTHLSIDVLGTDYPGECPFGRGLDPKVELYYGGCTWLAGIDDGTNGSNFRHIDFCLQRTGYYHLRITGLNNTAGPYVLRTTCEACSCWCPPSFESTDFEEPEHNNDTCAAYTMICPTEICGSIDHGGDVDWFVVSIPQTPCGRLTVEVDAIPNAGNLDPFVEMFLGLNSWCTSAGFIAADDNSGGGVNSLVSACMPTGNGVYYNYFRVSGIGNSTGAYNLAVNCEPCECSTSCPVNCLPSYRIEGEPPCGTGYVDNYNGECGTPIPGYQQLACGDTICGGSGAFTFTGGTAFDRDLYAVTLTERDTLKWSVVADFWAQIMIVTPGMIGCSQEEQQVHASTSGSLCDTLRVSACLDPGTYWLSVQSINALKACGTAEYLAWVSCAPCFCDATQEIVFNIENPYQCCCVDLSTGQFASITVCGSDVRPIVSVVAGCNDLGGSCVMECVPGLFQYDPQGWVLDTSTQCWHNSVTASAEGCGCICLGLLDPIVTIRRDAGGPIRLYWMPVSGALTYAISYSDSTPGGPWNPLGLTADTSYADTSAINSTSKRFYFVTAGN